MSSVYIPDSLSFFSPLVLFSLIRNVPLPSLSFKCFSTPVF